MGSEHKRPLYAFLVVAIVCAFCMVYTIRAQAFIDVLRGGSQAAQLQIAPQLRLLHADQVEDGRSPQPRSAAPVTQDEPSTASSTPPADSRDAGRARPRLGDGVRPKPRANTSRTNKPDHDRRDRRSRPGERSTHPSQGRAQQPKPQRGGPSHSQRGSAGQGKAKPGRGHDRGHRGGHSHGKGRRG